MFRRFSLFDSSPPAAKISLSSTSQKQPTSSKVSDRKSSSPLKDAILNTFHTQSSPKSILLNSYKRSKSVDHSSAKYLINERKSSKQRTKSATLPPIIVNRTLPQTNHQFTKRSSWSNQYYRSPVYYHVRFY